jgi:protein translocase SecG subunit
LTEFKKRDIIKHMNFIKTLNIIVAVLLMVCILLQNRGGGLSDVFGGGGSFYAAKRGVEKKIFIATIVLAIVFFTLSLYIIIS